MNDLTDFVLAGKGASIAKLQTTFGDGTSDVFVDMIQVPQNSVRLIQVIGSFPTTRNIAGVFIAAYVCDQTMAPNISPLLASGLLDINKIGAVVLAAPFGTGAIGFLQPFQTILAPGQFLRFATNNAPPNLNDVFNLSVLYSDIPSCECQC